MKNKIIIFSLILTSFFIACNEDDYTPPNKFSDVGWYTSLLRQGDFRIGINDFISFSDLSQGTIDHSWNLGEQDGTYFLDGPISRSDSVFSDFIIVPIEKSSLEETVHVLFTQSGLKTVNLYNTFKDSVAFTGYYEDNDENPDNNLYTFPAKKVGDKWVIDTTFVVDVFDTIVAEMMIRQEGVVVDHTNPMDTIYIEAGGTLEFIDMTTIGRPDTRQFNAAGASSSDSVATFVFKKLGVSYGTFASSRTSQNYPGDYDHYRIPAPFKVIPSSKPFELVGSIYELEDNTIKLPFNGEFAPFINQEAYFQVKLNGADAVIQSLKINDDDATILDIVLNEQIYKTDVITITLLDGNGLESTDTRKPVLFVDEPVVMFDLGNLLSAEAADFEDGGASGLWVESWESDVLLEYSTEQASSGSYSMKWTLDGVERKRAGKTMYNAFCNDLLHLKEGKTYRISYKMYIEPGSDRDATWPHITGGIWKGWWTDIKTDPVGEWFEKSVVYTRDAADLTAVKIMMRVTGDDTYRSTFYFDEIYVDELDDRP